MKFLTYDHSSLRLTHTTKDPQLPSTLSILDHVFSHELQLLLSQHPIYARKAIRRPSPEKKSTALLKAYTAIPV